MTLMDVVSRQALDDAFKTFGRDMGVTGLVAMDSNTRRLVLMGQCINTGEETWSVKDVLSGESYYLRSRHIGPDLYNEMEVLALVSEQPDG